MESILLKLFMVGTYFVKLRFCWSVYGWNLFRLYGMLALTYIGTRFSGKLVYIWNLFLENGIRVSLFVVIHFVKLGCVVSEVGCSILEIDLVKQAFLVRAIFLALLFWNAFLLKLTLVELFLLQKYFWWELFSLKSFSGLPFCWNGLWQNCCKRIFLVLLPYVACLSLCHCL